MKIKRHLPESEAPTRADRLEARCRDAMATLTEARGWDTQAARDEELAFIDCLLDEWNACASASSPTATS